MQKLAAPGGFCVLFAATKSTLDRLSGRMKSHPARVDHELNYYQVLIGRGFAAAAATKGRRKNTAVPQPQSSRTLSARFGCLVRGHHARHWRASALSPLAIFAASTLDRFGTLLRKDCFLFVWESGFTASINTRMPLQGSMRVFSQNGCREGAAPPGIRHARFPGRTA